MLDDPAVTEIVVQRPHEVGIERGGTWEWRNPVPEFDLGRLDAIGILAGSPVEAVRSQRTPSVPPRCRTSNAALRRKCSVTFPETTSITIRIPS